MNYNKNFLCDYLHIHINVYADVNYNKLKMIAFWDVQLYTHTYYFH